MTDTTIYLAAPFFSDAEREFSMKIVRQLERHWAVFLPFRDGVRMAELVANGVSADAASADVWDCDLAAIRRSAVIVAVLDGRVPDEGVCVEIGLAKAIDMPVIGLKTDVRSCFSWDLNPMITGAVSPICASIEELIVALSVVIKNIS